MKRFLFIFAIVLSLFLCACTTEPVPADETASTTEAVTETLATEAATAPEETQPVTTTASERINELVESGEVEISQRDDGVVRHIKGNFIDTLVETHEDAYAVIESIEDFLGIDLDNPDMELKPIEQLNNIFMFDQYYKGLRINGGGRVSVLINESGEIIEIVNTWHLNFQMDITPNISLEEVKEAISIEYNLDVTEVSELYIRSTTRDETQVFELMWDIYTVHDRFKVNANTGEIQLISVFVF